MSASSSARAARWPALAIAASLRATAVASEWWLSLVEPTQARVIAVIAVEQGFGGMLTTALFAFMMASVDRKIGASHFAMLATVEVGGKLIAASLSGVLADQTSYATVFGVATILSFAFLILLWPLARGRATGRDVDAGPSDGS